MHTTLKRRMALDISYTNCIKDTSFLTLFNPFLRVIDEEQYQKKTTFMSK